MCLCVCMYLHTFMVLPGKEALPICFEIKVHQCGFFSLFFLFFFNHGFRLLSANIYCLKLHFRLQGKTRSPVSGGVVRCLCSTGVRAALEAEVAPKGWHLVAAAMYLVADAWHSSADTASLAPDEWKKLSMYLGLPEILIMPNLYRRPNPITSGDFVKTLSTVQTMTAPKARTIKIS